MKFFYDKDYYQNIYNHWSAKKAILIIIATSLAISFIAAMLINFKLNKYSQVTNISKTIQALPKKWTLEDKVGLTVMDQNQEITEYDHPYFQIKMDIDSVTPQDFNETAIIIAKQQVFLNTNNQIQSFPITDLNIQGVQFSSLAFEINEKGILSFQNGKFARNISFYDIAQAISKTKRIIFTFILFIGGLILTVGFITANITFSFFMAKILNKKGWNLDRKKLFNSLAPLSYITLILFLFFSIFFSISAIIVMNIVLPIYSILIPLKLLKKEVAS
ncbi:MAG: hypothetical protein GY817_07275 [bacterium]|nr:hypothetical protein [bacterium]